jgi:hypothetical protein
MTGVEFVVTPEFSTRYDALDDKAAECVDAVILRLLAESEGAWARQNRVVGENGWAWLIVITCPGGENLGLYWQTLSDESLVLTLLLDR